jgi:hypothetical protein
VSCRVQFGRSMVRQSGSAIAQYFSLPTNVPYNFLHSTFLSQLIYRLMHLGPAQHSLDNEKMYNFTRHPPYSLYKHQRA